MVSDVDSDGVADVVVATDVGVTVIRGSPPQGAPATLELTTPVSALELAVGDLDGDGRPEIVAVSHMVVVVWTNACTL